MRCLDGRRWCVVQGCGPGCNVPGRVVGAGLCGILTPVLIPGIGCIGLDWDSTWENDKWTGPWTEEDRSTCKIGSVVSCRVILSSVLLSCVGDVVHEPFWLGSSFFAKFPFHGISCCSTLFRVACAAPGWLDQAVAVGRLHKLVGAKSLRVTKRVGPSGHSGAYHGKGVPRAPARGTSAVKTQEERNTEVWEELTANSSRSPKISGKTPRLRVAPPLREALPLRKPLLAEAPLMWTSTWTRRSR